MEIDNIYNMDCLEEIDNIYNMDCLEGMKQIPDGTIDAVICDLPYGTTACAWDSVIPFDKLWEQYRRICKPNAPIVLFGSEPFSTMLRMSNFECWKYDWIWDKVSKQGILNANIRPLKQHEIVSVFCYGKPPYYPQMDKRGKVRNKTSYNNRKGDGDGCYGKFDNIKVEPNNDYYPSTILVFSNAVQIDKFHPTQKPTPTRATRCSTTVWAAARPPSLASRSVGTSSALNSQRNTSTRPCDASRLSRHS